MCVAYVSLPSYRDIVTASSPSTAQAGRRVIAVIGIDRYRNWPRLGNAVSDANGARALFQRLGFEEITSPLFDEYATGRAIHALVTDELTSLGENDSLVLFYAGHGGTRTQRVGNNTIKTGYLIPVDAANEPNKVATWIELEDWLRRVSVLPPKHILVILDACHSGIALSPRIKWGRDTASSHHLPLATLQGRSSRVIITSALDDEIALDSGPVRGHSLFTSCLIQGLTGGLAGKFMQDGRWMTTGSDLGGYVRSRVLEFPEHARHGRRQTPDFGTFDYDDRGEMVLPVLMEAHGAQPSAVVSNPVVTPSAPRPDPRPVHAATPTNVAQPRRPMTPAQAAGPLVSSVPKVRRSDGAEPSKRQELASGKIFGISIARLRDPGLQKKILFLAGVALVASIVVPFSLDPLVFPWTGGGFESFLWPLISGGAYLLLTAAPVDLRPKVPPVLQWIPFGVACAGIFISHLGFGFMMMAVGGAAGVGGLYILGYSVVVFGLLARIAQPQDQIARIVIAVGAACLIPSWLDSFHVFSALSALPSIVVVTSLLRLLVMTLGVFCIVFVVPPVDAFGPLIAAVLIVWLPLQQVLLALAAIVHGHILIGSLLILGHGLLPILAYFGVFMMSSPAAYEEAKAMFSGRGSSGGEGG